LKYYYIIELFHFNIYLNIIMAQAGERNETDN